MALEALRFWDDPIKFNAGASAAIVLFAIVVTWRSSKHNEPRFIEDAHIASLLFWLASFVSFVTIPVFFFLKLVLVDVQSFLAVGVFFILFKGNKYDAGPFVRRLGLFALIWLIVHSVALFKTPWSDANAEFLRLLSTLPSQALLTAGLVMLGSVLVSRYGEAALFVLITAGVYATVQQPVYYSEFVSLQPIPSWWFWLVGLSKYALAGTFYWFFLTPLKRYDPIPLVKPDLPEGVRFTPSVQKLGSPAWTILVAATGHFIGAVVAGLVH